MASKIRLLAEEIIEMIRPTMRHFTLFLTIDDHYTRETC